MLKKRGPWAKAGDLLAVPLREVLAPGEDWPDSGDWGVGLVGVKPKDAHAILGWWFACRFSEPPTRAQAEQCAMRREVVLLVPSGSFEIRDGRWLNLGQFGGYKPDEWRTPLFVNRGYWGGPKLVVTDTESLRDRYYEVPPGFETDGLPDAVSSTCSAIEVKLSKTLSKYETETATGQATMLVREVDAREVLGPIDG